MTWSEISPGKYSRAVGENETFIRMLGDGGHAIGREHWSLSCISTFVPKGSLDSAELRGVLVHAWKLLRFHHPSIAVKTEGDDLIYQVPDRQSIDSWVNETFIVSHEREADLLVSKMRPSPYLTLHYLPLSSQLLLNTSHWRTDGIGILQLLDEYYRLVVSAQAGDIDRVKWGEEVPRLVPAVEDALSMPKDTDPVILQEAQRCFETFLPSAESVGVKVKQDSAPVPGGTRSSRLEFTEEATAAIVAACKRRDISVTSAMHAAVTEANYTLAAEDEKKKHFTSTLRFSFRPHLPAPLDATAGAAGLYTSGTMCTRPAGASWAANATHYQTAYKAGLSPLYIRSHRAYANKLVDLLKSLPPDAPSPSTVEISSFGIVDKIVEPSRGTAERGLDVKSVSVGVELLTKGMVAFFWTYRGRLQINLLWNESFHSPEGGDSVLKCVRQSLGLGLDIVI